MNSPRQHRERAFTLIEMIVAVGVFMILMSLFLTAMSGVQKIWMQGDRRVESMQNGRAVLEMFSRELAGALVSDRFQLVQTPELSSLVTKTPLVAENSPSLFWVGPVDSTTRQALTSGTASSDPCEVGYYLTRDDATQTYRLNRLVISPESPFYEAGEVAAKWNEVPWLTGANSSLFDPDSADGAVSPIAEGVIAMWIRCFDLAGNPIPWLDSSAGFSAASPIQFNSAAPFQMSARGASLDNGETFQYLNASTAQANRLPSSVEISIVLLDKRTLARKPTIPQMPAPTTPAAVPAEIRKFQDELTEAGIPFETFSVRVPLINSAP